MLESVIECPICQGKSFEDYLAVEDYTTTHEHFQIKKCTTCSFLLTSPRPDEQSITRYYQSEKYISHTGGSTSLFDKAYLFARRYALKKKLNLINRYSRQGIILDYGCGTGDFLAYMKQSAWKIEGVEPSQKARAKAELITSTKIHTDITDIKSQFDVITLWHVLEHIHDLRAKIEKISSLLAANGTLIIAVPNHNSQDARHYKQYWAAYDVPRHLWHFTKSDIEQLLKSFGLKIVEVAPMKLDGYYVSMLSELYKSPKTNFITRSARAAANGLYSNIKAQKTNNYSSLIYIAQR